MLDIYLTDNLFTKLDSQPEAKKKTTFAGKLEGVEKQEYKYIMYDGVSQPEDIFEFESTEE